MRKMENNVLECLIRRYYSSEVYSSIFESIPEAHSSGEYLIIDDYRKLRNIEDRKKYDLVVSFPSINQFWNINQDLMRVHRVLRKKGVFIGKAEIIENRKWKIENRRGLTRIDKDKYGKKKLENGNNLLYRLNTLYEFVFMRVLPKLPCIRHIYSKYKVLRYHMLSKCELLGRLCYCGFEIFRLKELDSNLYFVALKNSQPSREKAVENILIKVPKVGEGGRTIYCYKLRTMYIYANFLHDYILDNHKVDDNGKIVGDFRKTRWGRFLRKTWLDEMPQLYNVLKGDIYFIGLRPLSRKFLSLYPEEWRKVRMKLKPGFVPPYYADCPKSFEGIIESEKRYYERWKSHPHRTNFVYFWKVVWNFITGKVRTG